MTVDTSVRGSADQAGLRAPTDETEGGTTTTPRPPARRRGIRSWVRKGGLSTLLIALPAVVAFSLFSWWPIVRGMIGSFQSTNFVDTSWVGFKNFELVFSDPLLGQAALNTAWYALLALVFGFPVPVIMATIIAEMRRARQISSVLVFLPVIIPPVVSILLWKVFYDPGPGGLFNTIGSWFGLGPTGLLQSPLTAMPAIVLEATWAAAGSATIVYLATLMTIDAQLYEAAEIDGAGIIHRFWHVTLPQLRGTMLVLLLLQIIGTFQVFAEPYLFTGGGPNNATVTLLMLIFRYAFVNGNYGMATALSLLLAIVLGLVAVIYLRLTRRWSKS